MNISDLIAKLQASQKTYGDHPVHTWDGVVKDVKCNPSKNGILTIGNEVDSNEISMEFFYTIEIST